MIELNSSYTNTRVVNQICKKTDPFHSNLLSKIRQLKDCFIWLCRRAKAASCTMEGSDIVHRFDKLNWLNPSGDMNLSNCCDFIKIDLWKKMTQMKTVPHFFYRNFSKAKWKVSLGWQNHFLRMTVEEKIFKDGTEAAIKIGYRILRLCSFGKFKSMMYYSCLTWR